MLSILIVSILHFIWRRDERPVVEITLSFESWGRTRKQAYSVWFQVYILNSLPNLFNITLSMCREEKHNFQMKYVGCTLELNPSMVAQRGLFHSSSNPYVHRQWWRGLEGFEGVGALARLWVWCLMDGHSSAFLPLCTPNPSLSSPRWWTSSLLWRTDKRRPLSSHSALWTLTKGIHSSPSPAPGYVMQS